MVKYAPPDAEIEVTCSAGTYVRVLAADLGAKLGCGAHLAGLRRTRSGPFTEEQAVTEAELEKAAEEGRIEERLVPPVGPLGLPVLWLEAAELRRVLHGGEIVDSELRLVPGRRVSGVGPGGELVAILEVRPGRRLRPLRVLHSLAAGA